VCHPSATMDCATGLGFVLRKLFHPVISIGLTSYSVDRSVVASSPHNRRCGICFFVQALFHPFITRDSKVSVANWKPPTPQQIQEYLVNQQLMLQEQMLLQQQQQQQQQQQLQQQQWVRNRSDSASSHLTRNQLLLNLSQQSSTGSSIGREQNLSAPGAQSSGLVKRYSSGRARMETLQETEAAHLRPKRTSVIDICAGIVTCM
jgi:uncharacterized protein (DUF2235 family)